MNRPLELEIMIRYRVEVQHANLEETLDHLRENGSADIVSVRVPKGAAQVGMYRDGTPIVCKRCDGDGCEPLDLASLVDANDDPYGGGEPA